VRLDAAFPDGLYLSVNTDGEVANIDTNNGPEVAARMERLDAALPETAALPEWVRCAGPAAFAALECATLNLIGCAGGTFFAGCECVEYFTEGENSCY
jgi:hypothetical protein